VERHVAAAALHVAVAADCRAWVNYMPEARSASYAAALKAELAVVLPSALAAVIGLLSEQFAEAPAVVSVRGLPSGYFAELFVYCFVHSAELAAVMKQGDFLSAAFAE